MEAVGYHGEMDIPTRQESCLKWKSGDVKIVATKAFGTGIDKANIHHVIRNSVLESMLSWAQELGRAGRDGHQACATILYSKSDISHANSRILNNLSIDQERCKWILSGFSDCWRYVNAHLSGKCRRRLLMDIFGEESNQSNASRDCCDVCMHKNSNETEYTDHIEELKILLDVLKTIGCKGEVKLAE